MFIDFWPRAKSEHSEFIDHSHQIDSLDLLNMCVFCDLYSSIRIGMLCRFCVSIRFLQLSVICANLRWFHHIKLCNFHACNVFCLHESNSGVVKVTSTSALCIWFSCDDCEKRAQKHNHSNSHRNQFQSMARETPLANGVLFYIIICIYSEG